MWEYIVKSYRLCISVYCFCPCKFLIEYAIIVVQRHKKPLKRNRYPQHGSSREKDGNSICFVWGYFLTSASLPPSTVSFSISLSAVRCWLNQVREGRCRNRSIADENDNASPLFGYWDAQTCLLSQENASLCNLWKIQKAKEDRSVKVSRAWAGVIKKQNRWIKNL